MGMGGRDVGGLSLKWIDAVSPSSLFRAEFEAMPEDRVFPEGKVEKYGEDVGRPFLDIPLLVWGAPTKIKLLFPAISRAYMNVYTSSPHIRSLPGERRENTTLIALLGLGDA